MPGRSNFACCDQNFVVLHFLLFYALLSYWSPIYDVDFESNSSCLDGLNNFDINSLQKQNNLPQNAISRIAGTLM